jgi:hypothetical protein
MMRWLIGVRHLLVHERGLFGLLGITATLRGLFDSIQLSGTMSRLPHSRLITFVEYLPVQPLHITNRS